MAVSLQQFARRLVRSGLFSAEELAAFQQGLPSDNKPQTAQDLARELILADRLTRFQAEAVYQGKLKGLVMGEYVVLDRIGAGGMGEVLKAQHRRMKRVVALKVLPSKAVKSPDAVRRFYREVEAAARLNHPNIVTAHDASECDGIHYLVMEYVDGEDLAHVVKRRGPLPVDQAVECTIQAARGLGYAHEHGVIHRDIKPGNLLLDREGSVKILDMGLARLEEDIAGDDGPERLTSTGQIMGTVDYIAPEQAEDTHTADHRADIYSLGCTLCRLLTGKPPYSGETPIQVVMAHIQKPIPSICEVRPDVPAVVDAVLQKMLAKSPDDRYQSMGEVIEALEACREPDKPGEKLAAEAPSDSALTSFLDQLATGGSTGTKQRAATIAEETQPSIAPEEDTGEGLVGKLLSADRRTLLRYLGIGGGAALCVVLFGLLVAVLNRGGDNASPLPSAGEGSGVRAATGPPPPAKAPFDARRARWYQKQWADYLGLPVEWTNSVGMTFVLIPPGEFEMGSTEDEVAQLLEDAKREPVASWYRGVIPTEAPKHRVRITKPFWLAICEVRQVEYGQVMGKNPSNFKDDPNCPVESVSWVDALEFSRKLCGLPKENAAGALYRLPTEAEWEYACRAGTTTRYNFGDAVISLDRYAWSSSNSQARTHPVARLKPNAWGLFDMHGNVEEWCSDAPREYGKGSVDDPVGQVPGQQKGAAVRGGKWLYGGPVFRCATRVQDKPASRLPTRGFRVVCEIPTDPAKLKKFAAAVKASKVEPLPDAAESGSANHALEFDGKTSYVQMPTLKFDGSHPITLEAYVTPRRADVDQNIVGDHHGTGIALKIHPRGSWNVAVGRGLASIESPSPLMPAHTVHVAGVWDHRELRLYVDGKRVASTTGTSESYRPSPDVFAIGQYPAGRGCFDGTVDELRISSITRYDKDFTPQERFEPDEHTLALYHFDEGQGDVLHDSSGNGHHGKIVGAKWVKVEPPPKAVKETQAYEPITIGPPAKPVPIDIKPEPIQIKPGEPMSKAALVTSPATLPGARSWTIETRGLRDVAYSVAYSPDGRTIVAGGPSQIRLWDAATGRCTGALVAHDSGVLSLSWSPDGKYLASAGGHVDRRVRLWDVASRRLLRTSSDQGNAVRTVAWSPDGRFVASAAFSGKVVVAEVSTGTERHCLSFGTGANGVSWSADGKILAIGATDTPQLFDVEFGKILPAPEQFARDVLPTELGRRVFPVLWSPRGAVLGCGFFPQGKPPSVHLWDFSEKNSHRTVPNLPHGEYSLHWSPDGSALAVSAGTSGSMEGDNTVRVWGIEKGAFFDYMGEFNRAAAERGVSHLAWSPDGQSIAIGCCSGEVYVCEAQSGRTRYLLPACPVTLQTSVSEPPPKPPPDFYRKCLLPSLGTLHVSPQGHYRAPPEVEKQIVYVVLTESGEQLTLAPEEFAKKYGWKNDPGKAAARAESGKPKADSR